LRRAYPEVDGYANQYAPPLKYESASFDLIYSVSIFSHLPPADHSGWLAELARVAKPNALILLTIEGRTALQMLMDGGMWDRRESERMLADRGVLYREYSDLAAQKAHEAWMRKEGKYLGIQGSYGSTVMTPEYIADHWNSASLEVVNVIEGVVDNRQDIVVLKRR
jgi:ubiquinone/menaquinone biosynthesis C-methylase UbiE